MDQGLHAISDELYHAIFELMIAVAYLNSSANDTVIDIINNKGI